MKIELEHKVLYIVLEQIEKGKPLTAAPDKKYIDALVTLGIIKNEWNRTLTDFGRSIFNWLQNEIHGIGKW